MNILNKVSIKNLKLNKKRTISTIIGIILSTALICAACTLATSFQETLVQSSINQTGYYHLVIEKVKDEDVQTFQNNRDVKKVYTLFQEGYALLKNGRNEAKPYLKVCSMDKAVFEELKFNLLEGRFATNNNEIVISKHTIDNGGVNYKIGDTITLDIGKRETLEHDELYTSNPYNAKDEHLINKVKKEFKIVGIIERPNIDFENYSDPSYTVITTGEKITNEGRMNAYIALSNPSEYKTSIPELLGAKNMDEIKENAKPFKYDDYNINRELLRWEVFAFSDSTIAMLYTVVGVVVVIILFTSIFCIRNSFAISATEKIKTYGMLASVGSTKKQIKKSVIFESFILAAIGIPLGILSGIFAVFVLIQIVNYLLQDSFSRIGGIVLNVSTIPVVLSIVLGFLTVYLSAISSAKRASRVSPIEQLRNTQDIKMNNKKLRVPKIISKLFNIGGVLAYKNLKRSKKKYRTTVVSLTVSICIFITMNAFIVNALGLTDSYYTDYDYNIALSIIGENGLTQEQIKQITSLENIKDYHILYNDLEYIKINKLSKINKLEDLSEEIAVDNKTGKPIFDEKTDSVIYTGEKYMGLQVLALDSKSFKQYAKKIGAKYDEVRENGILSDTVNYYDDTENNTTESRVYKYNKNDILIGKYNGKEIKIKIGAVSKVKPYGYENYNYHGGIIVLDYEQHSEFDFNVKSITIDSENSDKLEQDIENLKLEVEIGNIDKNAKANKSMQLVVQIFLYGFITVITLIGVTNIFNTITSNMELRQKEFAMLKSIGMTKREFNRMINLETIFYGTKSLIYGIALGILGTFALYKSFAMKIDSGMYIPWNAILISIIFVFVLIFIIMRYSVHKINKQNTIETIRRENI